MLIIVMVVGGSFRYIDGYRYFPEAVSRFNKDLSLLRKNTAPTDSFSLLVSEEESPIYEALKKTQLSPDINYPHSASKRRTDFIC